MRKKVIGTCLKCKKDAYFQTGHYHGLHKKEFIASFCSDECLHFIERNPINNYECSAGCLGWINNENI